MIVSTSGTGAESMESCHEVVRKLGSHQPLACQGKGNTAGIKGDPPAPPLFGDIRRGRLARLERNVRGGPQSGSNLRSIGRIRPRRLPT